jgi:ribosomal protein L11 methyltransferase
MKVVEVPPRFRVVTMDEGTTTVEPDARTLLITRSSAFGDGEHESTRMCLQALAAFQPRAPFRLLDVGSGSGILSIAAAKLGGTAVGIEIDREANVVARENARRNGVLACVTFGEAWPDDRYEVVVANILRDVLLELAPKIVAGVRAPGLLVLSGLVSTDVPEVIGRYAPLWDGPRPEVFERGPWRALVFRGSV